MRDIEQQREKIQETLKKEVEQFEETKQAIPIIGIAKPVINQLVEFLRTSPFFPSEYKEMVAYFSALEGPDLVEQRQYDKMIAKYELTKQISQVASLYNPCAVAVLAHDGFVDGQ